MKWEKKKENSPFYVKVTYTKRVHYLKRTGDSDERTNDSIYG